MKNQTLLISGIVFFFILFGHFLWSPPADFPVGAVIGVKQGFSLHGVSDRLKKENIIRSRALFESLVILRGGEKKIFQGDYIFDKKVTVFGVAGKFVRAQGSLGRARVTIPEGFNVEEISETLATKISNFEKEEFLAKAKDKEGYLFPDTYFFFTTDTVDKIISTMNDNFYKKIKPLEEDIANSSRTMKDIIIMASIIEKEAKGDLDRATISGILWRRLDIKMPLQVDAEPSTYDKRGLPEAPIANPGFKAIYASLHPEKSPYLFYLHDKTGNIHYAKTFDEHNKNISKYLR